MSNGKIGKQELQEDVTKDLELIKPHIDDTNNHITSEERLKWNKAMLATGEYLSGDSVNFDKIITSGIYKVGDPTGAVGSPPLGYGILEVKFPEKTYIIQEFTVFTGEKFYRFTENTGASWTAWRQVQFLQQTYDSWNKKLDTVSVYNGGAIDPNTTLDGLILTSHANRPTALGGFVYIVTRFYSSISATSNRVQIAYPYSGGGGGCFVRTYNTGDGGWSPWRGYRSPLGLATNEKTDLVMAINELFNSVSSGKALVANAITGKGVSTATTAEFATMATNIGKINVAQSVNGTTVSTTGVISIVNLPFKPRFIMISQNWGDVLFNHSEEGYSNLKNQYFATNGTWTKYGVTASNTGNGSFVVNHSTIQSGYTYYYVAYK